MRQETVPGSQDLTVAGNVQSGSSWPCDHHVNKTVQVTGTFTGTVTVVGTIDGTNWAPVGSATLTAPGIVTVAASLKSLAIQGSSWSAGTATATYSYFNSRSDPG